MAEGMARRFAGEAKSRHLIDAARRDHRGFRRDAADHPS
jgi:hypothetical protein